MKKDTNTKQPPRLKDTLSQSYSGKQIERRFLTWLKNYYESLIVARPFDKRLSRKLDCVRHLIENAN